MPHPTSTAPSPASTAPVLAQGPGRRLRVTLHPGTDVLLEVGARLGDLRAGLADVACRPELLTAPLLVDGVPVDDDHRAGARPLLPGATVSTAAHRWGEVPRGPGSRVLDVLAAPWHVAVLTGPDAGRLVPVGVPAGTRRGVVAVDGLAVRWRRTRRGTAVRVRGPRGARRVRRREGAAVDGSPGARRGRRLGRLRGTAWRERHVVVHDGTAYALRPPPALEHRPRVASATAADAHATAASAPRPWAAHLATALTPAAASLVLAVTFRQPLYALLALVGPLALFVPVLLDARRRRAARTTPGGATHGRDDDAAPTVPPDPLRPRPADALTWAAVAHLAPDGTTVEAVGGARVAGSAGSTAGDAGADPPALPDGCVAVVGPRPAALAAARAVLAELLASGPAVTVRHAPAAAADWSWCRWLPRASTVRRLDGEVPARAAADVLVVDGATSPGELAAAWARLGPAGTRLVLVVADARSVPAWCRTVLHVDGRTAVLTGADGARTVGPHVGVGTAWAQDLARHLAAADHLGRLRPPATTPDADGCDPAAPSLPADVSLGALLGAPASGDARQGAMDGLAPDVAAAALEAWVARRWDGAAARDGRGLRTPLGVGADGAVVSVDLVADGPHVLVAGTTGAGKSELLQTLVAGLALGRSPAELTFALVDFKGGASFGACSQLPHVVGQVTDLDAGLAGRALAGLRAELHRRERVLADAGVASVDELPAGTLPRLVVVIDEFRALADDLPDFLPGLLRVAAQGRSLGVHLVLATQRPAGAVSADVRANITLRIALRVVDAADSRDVVESPHASLVPARTPGRLVLRCGAAPPVALQCARAGAPAPAVTSGAQAAPGWTASWTTEAAAPARAVGSPPDALTSLVDAARAVATRTGLRTPPPPWLPALPDRVVAGDLETWAEPGPDVDTLPVALGDVPALQRRTVVRWDPRDGHLAVLGHARSGRTTALRALAHAALARGWHVHAIGTGLGDLAGHPGTGTLVDRGDARRTARLLRLLAGHDDGQVRPAGLPPATARRTLVLVDDVESVRAALSALAGGAGADLLADALADSPAAFALTGSGPTVAGLAPHVGVRAVLASRDRHDDVSLGVPTALAGQGGLPGRAVWLGPGEPVVCQLVLPDPAPGTPDTAHPRQGLAGTSTAGPGTAGRGTGSPGGGPVRLAAIPDRVSAEDVGAGGPGTAVVGRGGDDAGPVVLAPGAGALVVGPPGSGRSTALALLARRAAATGTLRGVLARDARLVEAVREVAGDDVPVVSRFAPADVAAFLDAVGTAGDALPRGERPVVVVDDLDQLVQLCVLEADRLAATCRDDVALVASAATAAAAMALRGPLAEVRALRRGLVLGPSERGSADVFGHDLAWLADPGRPRAGRGVLVDGARTVPVQVARVW